MEELSDALMIFLGGIVFTVGVTAMLFVSGKLERNYECLQREKDMRPDIVYFEGGASDGYFETY